VSTAIVKKERWQPTLGAVGSLKAVNGITVSTDLAGIVSEIAFESGQAVQQGDLLIRLDSQQEEARLQSAKARLDLAKTNLQRHRDLVQQGAVSQSAYDTAESEMRQATAAVDEARALIARKTIVAPFDGVLGIRQADLGQYLEVGAPIVALESVDPIYVEFAFPQQDLEKLKIGGGFRLEVAGLSGKPFEGVITAIDSRLDEKTRNIMVQGTVDNPDHALRAGMFAQVDLLMPEVEIVAIPASSIKYAPYGDSVFVVKDDMLEEQFVKLGQNRGDQVGVLSGLEEGDEVVSSGVFKLRGGMAVQINNSVQPANDVNPTPPNS
jgi:membrane fusion protein (multidrug efflux system)